MKAFEIRPLAELGPGATRAAEAVLAAAFNDPARYSLARLAEELQERLPTAGPYYRCFFVALVDGEIVGVAGVKAADWASDLHLLYLSAVLPAFRSRGIGRKLVRVRLQWLEKQFGHGRVMVSTRKPKRFHDFGFKAVPQSQMQGRQLMLRRF